VIVVAVVAVVIVVAAVSSFVFNPTELWAEGPHFLWTAV